MTWIETKLGIHYFDLRPHNLILYIEPFGSDGFTAYVHRFGSFDKHNERDFIGQDALARAKEYLTPIANLLTGQPRDKKLI